MKNLRSCDLRLTFGCPLLCSLFLLCVSQYRWKDAFDRRKLPLNHWPSPELHIMETERLQSLDRALFFPKTSCPLAIFHSQGDCFFGTIHSMPLPKRYVKLADITMVGMKRCVEAGGQRFFYSILCPYLRGI
jgi:hypothetical protein